MNTIINMVKHFIPIFLFFLLLINTLTLFNKRVNLAEFGAISLELTLYLSVTVFIFVFLQIYFAHNEIHRNLFPLYSSLFSLLLIYLISHTFNQNFNFDTTLLYLFISYVFFLCIILIKWSDQHLITMSIICNFLIVLILIFWRDSNFPTNRFAGIYVNTNLSSILIFCLLFFQLLSLKFKNIFLRFFQILLILSSIIIIYITSSRAALLAIFVVFLSWFIYKFNDRIFSKLFYFVIGINTLFLYIYTKDKDSLLIKTLDEISNTFFKKGVFSGREWIWKDAIEFGLTSPLIGHRIDIQPYEYIPNTGIYHVHNYYIQVFLESGVLGIIAFILFLYFIWRIYMRNLENYVVRLSACFFIGILVYWNLDLSSFFINKAIGLLFWFIIGLGLSASIYNEFPERKRRKSMTLF